MSTDEPEKPRRKSHKIRNFVMFPALGLIVLIVIIVALTSGGEGGPQGGPPNPPAATQEQETPSEQSNMLAFGESYEWPGGESVTASPPTLYTESNPYLSAPEGKRYAAVDVTVRNNGDAEFDVMQMQLTARHAGRVAQQNPAAGDPLPQTVLPPGDEVTFTSVFEVGAEPGKLTVSVAPNPVADTTAYYNGKF